MYIRDNNQNCRMLEKLPPDLLAMVLSRSGTKGASHTCQICRKTRDGKHDTFRQMLEQKKNKNMLVTHAIIHGAPIELILEYIHDSVVLAGRPIYELLKSKRSDAQTIDILSAMIRKYPNQQYETTRGFNLLFSGLFLGCTLEVIKKLSSIRVDFLSFEFGVPGATIIEFMVHSTVSMQVFQFVFTEYLTLFQDVQRKDSKLRVVINNLLHIDLDLKYLQYILGYISPQALTVEYLTALLRTSFTRKVKVDVAMYLVVLLHSKDNAGAWYDTVWVREGLKVCKDYDMLRVR